MKQSNNGANERSTREPGCQSNEARCLADHSRDPQSVKRVSVCLAFEMCAPSSFAIVCCLALAVVGVIRVVNVRTIQLAGNLAYFFP